MKLVIQAVQDAVSHLFDIELTVGLTRPESQFGDYATNIAMQLAGQVSQPPRDIAQAIVDYLLGQNIDWLISVMVAGPGFINLTLTDQALYATVSPSVPQVTQGTTYVVEYSCPNAFKELHAGHLYQTIAGDAIARMLEQAGSTVHRTNFGGDVGLHVAKAMWGIITNLGGEYPDKLAAISPDQQAAFLSKGYVDGAAVYEQNVDAKQSMESYNQKIYAIHSSGDISSTFAQIYWTCRQWSYDYFGAFYERLQVNPFTYYPESSTIVPGLELVQQGLASGIFEHSDGAVVYSGDRSGLHTRVFVTSAGLPTYEAKDLGVISLEYKDYNFDHRVLITGRDQTEYMKVVFAAAGEVIPQVRGTMTHLSNGLIKFGDGTKMSSRLGNVTSASEVLNIISTLVVNNNEHTKNALMLGAVKYAFLKQRLGGDVAFDPEASVSLHGNSGPYLQYALVRARSILAKASADAPNESMQFEPSERKLVQKLAAFTDECTQAITDYAPHILCTYLYDLAAEFNSFYEENRVLNHERSDIRLQLVADYAAILNKGLELLGIERLERM